MKNYKEFVGILITFDENGDIILEDATKYEITEYTPMINQHEVLLLFGKGIAILVLVGSLDVA